jgi:hypothetical protein
MSSGTPTRATFSGSAIDTRAARMNVAISW